MYQTVSDDMNWSFCVFD